MRRNEYLRAQPCHLDMRRVGDLDRERMIGDMECVRIERVTLETIGYLIHNSVVSQRSAVRGYSVENDEIVQLDHLSLFNADPEIQRSTLTRSEDDADNFVFNIHVLTGLSCQEGFDATSDDPLVTKFAPQESLQCADRQKVLRGTSIKSAASLQFRQEAATAPGQHDRLFHSHRCGYFEP